jgi:hypothetical protein
VRSIIVVFLLLVASPTFASEDGYVYGNNHCFYFETPEGWIADNISGRRQGLPFVFYPKNSTWANATIVVYARVTDKADALNSPADQVEQTLKQFRTEYESPNIRAHKVGAVRAKSGAIGEIYRFEGDKWGNTELVAYFNGDKTINFFVMSSRDSADLERNRQMLEQLAQTYREANDCKPCPQSVTAPCGIVALSEANISQLEERNKSSVSTPQGQSYEQKAVAAFFGDAAFMRECVAPDGPIAQPLTIYFEVKPGGRMGKLVIYPQTDVAKCIAKNIGYRHFPEPPGEFVVKIDLKFKE